MEELTDYGSSRVWLGANAYTFFKCMSTFSGVVSKSPDICRWVSQVVSPSSRTSTRPASASKLRFFRQRSHDGAPVFCQAVALHTAARRIG